MSREIMVECTLNTTKGHHMGMLKWYAVYRIATRGRRRRKAEERARALLPTVAELSDNASDIALREICDDCGEALGDHLADGDEILCP